MTDFSYRMMRRALECAERGFHTTWPNPRVGCVITNQSCIIAEGYHHYAGGPHAEVCAIQNSRAPLAGTTLFVTLEPCAHHGKTGPCAEQIVQAGIHTVYIAVRDPNPITAGKGVAYLRAHGIQVIEGLCEQEARRLNIGFFSRYERQRPWTRLKQAMSLDAKTALSSGDSQWITGETARRNAHHWRARADVIATGIGSVLTDNPTLNVREIHVHNQPLCVVFDSRGQIPAHSRLFDVLRPVIIFCASMPQNKRDQLMDQGVEVIDLPDHTGNTIDLPAALQYLAKRSHSELHLEAGHRLAGSFMNAGLIDECLYYVAPKLMGEEAIGLMAIPQAKTMEHVVQLHLESCTVLGEDILARYLTNSGKDYLNHPYIRFE